MAKEARTIEDLLKEKRSFLARKEFREKAHVKSESVYKKASRNIAEGGVLGDTTTLADSTVVRQLKDKYEGKEE